MPIDRSRLASLFARTGITKDSPGVSDVHVPSPNWSAGKGKKRTRRYQLAALVRKSAGDPAADDVKVGTYMGRMVQNAEQLREWWATTRLASEPDALDANTHCTVIYSRAVVDPALDASHIVVQPDRLRFGVLGKDNAVVLFLDAPLLVARNAQLHAQGALEDYDSHQPHVTLFYLGAGYDSTDWRDGSLPPVPPFPIVLGPELCGPLGTDVYEAAKVPDWYVPSGRTNTTKDDRVHVTVNVQAPPAPNVQVTLPAAEPPKMVRKLGTITRGADGVAHVEISETPAEEAPTDVPTT